MDPIAPRRDVELESQLGKRFDEDFDEEDGSREPFDLLHVIGIEMGAAQLVIGGDEEQCGWIEIEAGSNESDDKILLIFLTPPPDQSDPDVDEPRNPD